jgi:hypothetical protein
VTTNNPVRAHWLRAEASPSTATVRVVSNTAIKGIHSRAGKRRNEAQEIAVRGACVLTGAHGVCAICISPPTEVL